MRYLNNHISDKAVGSYRSSSALFIADELCSRDASRVSESLRNTWPIVLVRDIRDQLLDKIPFSLSSIFSLSSRSLFTAMRTTSSSGIYPYRWKGLDLQKGNPNFHRVEGPPPNSMG